MNNGWFKIHRKIIEDPVFSNGSLLKVFLHCISAANYEDRETFIGNQKIKIPRGSFVTGRFAWGVQCHENPETARLYMKLLEKHKYITIKTTNKFSLVTIKNYNKYQDNTSRIPTEYQQNTTTKKYKESKEVNNIYTIWNSLDVIRHRTLSEEIVKAAKRALRKWSSAQIIEAMKNYARVYHSKIHFFKYKWRLEFFLSRATAIPQFLNESDPWNNFMDDKKRDEQLEQQQKDLVDVDGEKVKVKELLKLKNDGKIYTDDGGKTWHKAR